MLAKQPNEVAWADAEAISESRNVGLVERTRGDQPQRPTDRRPCAVPGRRERGRFRSAAQTRAKSANLRRGGAGIVADVLRQRLARWADRTAIDPGGQHGNEDDAVEGGIAAVPDPLAIGEVKIADPGRRRLAHVDKSYLAHPSPVLGYRQESHNATRLHYICS